MIREMLRREARYQVIMAVLRSFLRHGVINKCEYRMAGFAVALANFDKSRRFG